MLDINEYIHWLNQLFSNKPIYYSLFIVNVAFNIGIFSVSFFNYITYRKQYAIFFFLLSSSIVFSHISFAFYLFGLINPQIYYLGIHFSPLLGTWGMYGYMTKLLNIPFPKKIIYLYIFHSLLTVYICFSFPSFSTSFLVIHFINLGLKFSILTFVIIISYKTYKEGKLEKLFLLLGTLVVLTTIILYFPVTEPKNIIYPIKAVTIFINTFFNAYFIGYLNARNDKQTTIQQVEVIKLANENHYLLLNQKAILEQQVAERTLELQKSNTLKDKLFATIGHDLRNAVVILKTSLSIFDKKKEDNTHQMQKQVDGLYNTLDNLLEWSVLQLNKNEGNFKRIAIKDNVDDCLDFLSYNLRQKNIRVILAIQATNIYTNEHQLSIILRNLVSNAIKFTPVNGFIKIAANNINTYVELIITDTGIGIPPALLATLFNDTSFQSRTGTEGEKGTGLGLKLCKELIENQGGTIAIESELNTGTSVKIKLLA